jgi:type IV pilus assembly protein PilO
MQLGLHKLPWFGQVGVVAVLCAAGYGAFWHFYETPAAEANARVRQDLQVVRAEVAKAAAIERRLPEFRAEVSELEARLDSLKPVLPEQKDVSDLLRRLQTLATQSNLEIRAFRPLAITQREVHAEWPIALELDGTYHDLGMFFDKVAKVPRIINVSDITIRGRQERGRTGPSGAATVSATCLATTFVLSEAPAAAARPAGKTPAGRQARTPAAGSR